MQFLAIVLLLLWIGCGISVYNSEKGFYGRKDALVSGILFGLLFSMGVVGVIMIAAFIIAAAMGYIV